MTRDEAIEILKENVCSMCAYFSQSMASCDIRACDNRDAIKALEQEPCDDAVSKKDMWKAVHECEENNVPAWVWREMLSQLPTVTPKPKTGHWIYDDQIQNWICSECNETPKTIGYVGADDFMKEHFKYCNHCGAKMESEDCK